MSKKMILGAICGDIVGSPYEFSPIKSKEFDFINQFSEFTDDTVMTVVNMEWLLGIKEDETEEECKERLISLMHEIGVKYPNCGYGGHFYGWLINKKTEPYYSWGNGSAMRVSPVGWMFDTIEDVLKYSKISAEVTHNHPEGIKGAQATAAAIFLARNGKTKKEICDYIIENGEFASQKLLKLAVAYRFAFSRYDGNPENIAPTVDSDTEWSSALTMRKPANPQIAPEITMVRIITFFVFIPIYFAVFSDSPTTEISYPCFVYF